MTTRLRGANLEQESTDVEEGVGELSVEEKYVEVKQLIALGKEKGFLLYDEIYEILPEEVTSLPEELDEIYIRFTDLGIDVIEDAEKQLAPSTGKGTMTVDGAIEESSRPPAASSTRPTILSACICAKWGRSSCSIGRAKSTSRSALKRASARSTRRSRRTASSSKKS
ncbi:MAG: hypothetical protein DMF59_00980 [Acidobacteria bacterium]|nr:MAG: hypothetical protein DMF59_00980 [Acidobacteriota bacterium]